MKTSEEWGETANITVTVIWKSAVGVEVAILCGFMKNEFRNIDRVHILNISKIYVKVHNTSDNDFGLFQCFNICFIFILHSKNNK